MWSKILIDNWWISSQLLVDEAKNRWIKHNIISKKDNLFILQWDTKEVYCKSVDCWLNTSLWLKIANNKELTYRISEQNDIRVPQSIYVNREEWEQNNIHIWDWTFPVITKPVDGAHWDGIALNIYDFQQLLEWLKHSFENTSVDRVIIQEQITWEDHRIILVGWKVKAVTKRIPPYIIWDGKSSIYELIVQENNNPLRGDWKDHDAPMSLIKIDDDSSRYIQNLWYSLKSILEQDKKIYVRENANLSTGGYAIDMTDVIDDSIKFEAEKIAQICGLWFCGVDFFCEDISQPIGLSKWAIIEINATPGIRMHHFPSEGKSRNIAGDLLDYIF